KFLNPEKIANTLSQALSSAFGDKCDLLHIHNPMLAKNSIFLAILKSMQQKGYTLFLQVHDFAEDGRPLAYYFNEPYIANCHYGVINSRDYDLLLQSGLKAEGLHLLPNTVDPISTNSNIPIKKSRVLYPVRAIRRKNIGEAILLSLFFSGKTLSITLPPNSPADMKSYNGWKDFVLENNLDVEFESGLRANFQTLISSSDFLISTSITEGFGFSFLEPWTADKMLWGRSIPDVCRDFKKNGVDLDHLYQRLHIPASWIGKDALLHTFMSCISENSKKFNVEINKKQTQNFFLNKIESGGIDFGLLGENFQKKAISKILSSKKNKELIIDFNPYLTKPGFEFSNTKLISNNKKAVLQNYSKAIYKNNLIKIYKKVTSHSVTHCINKNILASYFLKSDNFSLLKWGDYVE
ncbi:MAG: glycosyltransferase family 1 protein, partial [Deltaproteobacteria bacterium]|nr:glycosyltransferase family 1 protein [Deltaproteobacteria bacterium]